MAKLTLSFKDRKLKVFALEPDGCVIGRDPACDIVIDSLAVAPRHARIHGQDERFLIEALSAEHELMVGDAAVAGTLALDDGDTITIGKHRLVFSTDSAGAPRATVTTLPSVGWLQIQNGSHMGRTIRLDRAFIRIGRPDGELAVIARRNDGYYLSALNGEQGPRINGEQAGDNSYRLQNGDRVNIGELEVQFFSDNSTAQASGLAPAAQRKFSRIPFNVGATLKQGEQTWESRLLDISLHGALIKAPAAFEVLPETCYQLTIHLEDGPDIRMDVHIAHSEDEQLGLECKDIDVDSITHLRRLVELNLGDPELLERELSALG